MYSVIGLLVIGLSVYAAFKVIRRILIAVVVAKYRSRIGGKTFDAYKFAHADNLKDGRVSCYQCGASAVYAKSQFTHMEGDLHEHICRVCGTELYWTATGRMKDLLKI